MAVIPPAKLPVVAGFTKESIGMDIPFFARKACNTAVPTLTIILTIFWPTLRWPFIFLGMWGVLGGLKRKARVKTQAVLVCL